MGGLFSGALLAKNGCTVTIIEKNATCGGGLQTFRRHGVKFDSGMHIVGGYGPGGTLRRICNYLGIMEQLPIRDTDADCMDSVTYADSGITYRLASGREKFTESLCSYFPNEAEGIRNYVSRMYEIVDEVPLYRLKPQPAFIMSHSDDFFMPADEFINRYLKDEKLRDLAAYLNPLYGGMKGHTPTYIHALINALYIDGSSRFDGGSDCLSQALTGIITKAGGNVLTGAEVTRINATATEGVTSVETADGRTFTADSYVFAAFPEQLNRLLHGYAFPPIFRRRLAEIPVSTSVFTLYITFRPGTFPYINHTCYWQKKSGIVWNHTDSHPYAPSGFMYITPPESGQGAYASKMIVSVLCNFSEVEQWSHTTVPGRRGDSYMQWKHRCEQGILSVLRTLYPDIDNAIEFIDSASPLTVRDYYGIRDGSMYGYRKDSQNIMLSQMNIHTRLRNLYLTGQNVNLHGICGVPLTAIETAEAILGAGTILNNMP